MWENYLHRFIVQNFRICLVLIFFTDGKIL